MMNIVLHRMSVMMMMNTKLNRIGVMMNIGFHMMSVMMMMNIGLA